jgi:2-polyprenyl-6-methoxyphenol hydroxylase-like FAD-dependent oxidoreductase
MKLRERARQCKNVTCIQASASELIYEKETVVGVRLNNGDDLFANLVVVADGYVR